MSEVTQPLHMKAVLSRRQLESIVTLITFFLMLLLGLIPMEGHSPERQVDTHVMSRRDTCFACSSLLIAIFQVWPGVVHA